ncbi:Uncharacterized protein Fot_30530 [Forsythia ovata]|uniref:Uncharacterized protein n=1 Tax=Forsythia ovata TaxID=205694 RepID=A0ABD1TV23_9LAMI
MVVLLLSELVVFLWRFGNWDGGGDGSADLMAGDVDGAERLAIVSDEIVKESLPCVHDATLLNLFWQKSLFPNKYIPFKQFSSRDGPKRVGVQYRSWRAKTVPDSGVILDLLGLD